MRVITAHNRHLALFRTQGSVFSYAVLLALLIAAPWMLGAYLLSQLVFVFIYAIVGIGLVLLSGYAGQVSIGHAAFFAIGAYTTAVLQKYGVPLPLYLLLAGALAGVAGYFVGLPAMRLHGIYLAIATLAFAFIVEEVLARWESVTNGNEGLTLRPPAIAGWALGQAGFFYLCLGLTVVCVLLALNLIRSPTGRAFVAIRDSETAARSMGIDIARYKTRAFAISSAMTGIAGALYAHKLSYISPEMFTLSMSIEFVMIIIIGGMISIRGAVFGAIFMIMVDPALVLAKDRLPMLMQGAWELFGAAGPAAAVRAAVARVVEAPGLKSLVFGLIIILFIVFEPMGLNGRWEKVKAYFRQFPLYKQASFKRQKMYLKSERGR